MKNLFAFLSLALFIPDGCACAKPEPPPKVDVAHEQDAGDASWHDRYVEDNCARCPECCVTDLWDSTEAELDGDVLEDSGCGEGEDILEDIE